MSLVTGMIFLLSYIISCTVLFFIGRELNLKKWFSENNIRKVIGFIISLLIYIVGNMIMDKFNITGNCHIILKGILSSPIAVTVMFILPNVIKTTKVNS